ncbi:lipopolysaccharide kinase [Aspergillus niger]|uniref:uncharacterized protein n=1 Tax=Aspergillus lacticoffeatus (strain CBS 101883) TaxID=1450533 RepID=UPI000D803FAA|nr:uncharacterized protein BO96DRAFT_472680 [Aspergillus niger CBS 101883]PYH62573.1 hypothetical protein BO96DRAFT_472680 [Aspergillus niger CBS 101883]GJP92640.1 lipopolysaccharide kinase [Aspergillus niger]
MDRDSSPEYKTPQEGISETFSAASAANTKAEKETQRTDAEILRARQNADAEVQRARQSADAEVQRALAEVQRARQSADAEIQRALAEVQRARAAEQSAEEDKKQAQEDEKKARKEGEILRKELKTERKRSRRTTFGELLQHCHTIFSAPLKVEELTRCTKGKIPQPKGKYCPLKFEHWEDCDTEQQKIYQSVRKYLEPPGSAALRLFTSRLGLESMGEYFGRPISSERDVEALERFTVESQVHKIITELCNIPAARDEFHLGTGVRFDSHANCLDDVEADREQDWTAEKDEEPLNCQNPRPDQYCIYQVDGDNDNLIMTVEYKPPHKLPVETIRLGLHPMEFWKEIVNTRKIPTGQEDKKIYDAAVLTGSAVVQEYHVMIMNGLEYSYVSTGLALIMLRVPSKHPSTLYYRLFEPNSELTSQDDKRLTAPLTSVARLLCLCLMSCSSEVRDKVWRESAKEGLKIWTTGFDEIPLRIPQFEPDQSPTASQHSHITTTMTIKSHTTSSEYQPSHPSVMSSPTESYEMLTRSSMRRERPADKDIDAGPTRQKRRTGGAAKRSGRQNDCLFSRDESYEGKAFCTQRCLLGLQRGGSLDKQCPNVALHRKDADVDQHPIAARSLVQQINQQLNEDVDHGCTPMGCYGSAGALFKITSSRYGYTVVGKGASAHLWRQKVSYEADVYRILHQAQGSAVPVFLGTIDLKTAYFLHGAVEINHMLLMAWGGERIRSREEKSFKREFRRSEKEARSLGVLCHDLRPENSLWNAELRRALIIDFDRSQLDPLPVKKRQILKGKTNRDPYGRKRPCSNPLDL